MHSLPAADAQLHHESYYLRDARALFNFTIGRVSLGSRVCEEMPRLTRNAEALGGFLSRSGDRPVVLALNWLISPISPCIILIRFKSYHATSFAMLGYPWDTISSCGLIGLQGPNADLGNSFGNSTHLG